MGYFMRVDSKALFTSTYIDEYQSYINMHVASINSSLGLKVTERSIDRWGQVYTGLKVNIAGIHYNLTVLTKGFFLN